MSKGMKYCKQHGKFDACAEMKGNPSLGETPPGVSKAYKSAPKPGDPGFMGHAIKNAHKRHQAALRGAKESMAASNAVSKGDDGINHLTGTSGTKTSPERRTGAGKLVCLEVGNREFDGTPMRGNDPKAKVIRPENKMGSSTKTKPIGGSAIREQVAGPMVKKNHDAFLAPEPVAKRFFSEKSRKKDAKEGDALPDGSFPIKNKKDLSNAEKLEGHSKHPAEVAAFIDRKKKELSKSVNPFEIEKALFGQKGDKRNTKYAATAYGGAAVGGLAGGASGAHIGGSSYKRVMGDSFKVGVEHGLDHPPKADTLGGAVKEAMGNRKALKAKVMREVPAALATRRGANIGSAVGAAGAVGAYALHRHNKVQKNDDPFEVEKAFGNLLGDVMHAGDVAAAGTKKAVGALKPMADKGLTMGAKGVTSGIRTGMAHPKTTIAAGAGAAGLGTGLAMRNNVNKASHNAFLG